jgi:hypothetical protein
MRAHPPTDCKVGRAAKLLNGPGILVRKFMPF